MLLRHSILIHTTDPELYLILRYILEQAGHDVDLLPSLDMFYRMKRIVSHTAARY